MKPECKRLLILRTETNINSISFTFIINFHGVVSYNVGEAPGKHLLITFDLIKLVFNNLVFIPLGMLSPKMTTFRFSDVKGSMLGSW